VLHRGHPASVDLVQNVRETLVSNHHMQSCPALEKPVLLGWFVGQMMKALNSNADPDEMLRKVVANAGQKKT
jgi:Asp-tRNA(Asn)/Glu-tRNA(Gln) amidotransferase B subunit